jgi:hypothetical protein
MIATQDRPKLEGVAKTAGKTRTADRARSQNFDTARRVQHRAQDIAFKWQVRQRRGPGAVIGKGAAYDPQLRPIVAAEEIPTFDASTIGADPAGAITKLREFLKETPGDYHLVRLLAVAQLANRDMPAAAASIAQAYEADPLLVSNPLDSSALGLAPSRITALINASQTYAANGGANAHLLTLVLQQAQGQTAQAKATLERARKAGLSPELADLFAAGLNK